MTPTGASDSSRGTVRSILRGQLRRRELVKHVAGVSLLPGRLLDDEGYLPVPGPRRARLVEKISGGRKLTLDFDGETGLVADPDSKRDDGSGARPAVIVGRENDEWSQQATLSPDGEGVQFGAAVAVNDGTALVGDPFGRPASGDEPGVVWAFDRTDDGWTRTAELTPPAETGTDRFGTALALVGETALVGAPTASPAAVDELGTVSVFARTDSGWTHREDLTPGEPTVGRFGSIVAFDGNTAVVSASRRTEDGTHSGLALAFDRRSGRWVRTGRLSPATGACQGCFGADVAVDDDTVLVGAPRDANGSGTAYLFVRDGDTWTRRQRFRPVVGGGLRRFGSAVALDGETAVVVAEADSGTDGERAAHGAAHVYRRGTGRWQRQRVVPVGNRGTGRELAATAALVGDATLVGTRGARTAESGRTGTPQSGGAYLVEGVSGHSGSGGE